LGDEDVLLVGIGAMAATAVEVAERLVAQGIGVTVVDPRWIYPIDPDLVRRVGRHRLVVSIEDNGRAGGYGSVLGQELRDAGVTTTFRDFAVPQVFFPHRKRTEVLAEAGLTAQEISRDIVELFARQQEMSLATARSPAADESSDVRRARDA
jgi:1-deoxy-D-xylulose-5-phosphate synthase